MSSTEGFGSPEDFESDEIGVTLKTWIFMRGLWSVETFVFVVSFSLSWVIGNTVLLNRVEVILRKLISTWCSSQNPTPTQSFRVKPLEISYQFSQFLQWQRRKSYGLWGICSNWGVRNSPVWIAYTVRNMIALRNSNLKSDHCCATRQLSKISYHLTVISLKGIYVLSCRAAP